MALNIVWVGLFGAAFAAALWRWLVGGDAAAFPGLLGAMFDSARSGFELSLGLAGIMTLWLGLMRVGERAGMVASLARLASPVVNTSARRSARASGGFADYLLRLEAALLAASPSLG